MSGKSRSIQLAWLGHRLLAIAGGDLIIRLWNCESNETWILPIPQDAFHSGAEQFTSLAFRHQLLMAGTNLGNVCFWHQQQQMTVSGPDDDWQFIGLVGLSGGTYRSVSLELNSYLCSQWNHDLPYRTATTMCDL